MSHTFLHVDMDAFFASVEQRDHPELRGKPVAVGASPNQRGVVAAASYEARAFGIRSAMPSSEAGRLCPHAVFVPVNGKRYKEVSLQIMAIFERFTPLVEPLSIDEAFLDVSGSHRLFGDGVEIARRIRETIRNETGLTASVGVATNKFLAKLASDMDKPDGLTVVPESLDEIIRFLAPLSVSRLWGVGRVSRQALEAAGLRTVGDLQNTSETRLASLVGKHAAQHFRKLAMGEDSREIETEREEKSISREHTFPRDCTSPGELANALCGLAEEVGEQLRAAGKFAGIGRLKLRWQGFKTLTRQKPFPEPRCDDISLREMAKGLLGAERLIKPVRLIGFGVSALTNGPDRQLGLFDADNHTQQRKEDLSRAIDTLRSRHGKDIIGRARTAGLIALLLFGAGCASLTRPDDPWLGRDKAKHFAAGAAIAAATTAVALDAEATDADAMALGFGVSLSFGAGKEGWDRNVRHTYWSWKDFCWDLAGAALGAWVVTQTD